MYELVSEDATIETKYCINLHWLLRERDCWVSRTETVDWSWWLPWDDWLFPRSVRLFIVPSLCWWEREVRPLRHRQVRRLFHRSGIPLSLISADAAPVSEKERSDRWDRGTCWLRCPSSLSLLTLCLWETIGVHINLFLEHWRTTEHGRVVHWRTYWYNWFVHWRTYRHIDFHWHTYQLIFFYALAYVTTYLVRALVYVLTYLWVIMLFLMSLCSLCVCVLINYVFVLQYLCAY